VIVTQNLKDGPPENERGIQIFDDVLYLDPDDLPEFLDRWGDVYEASEIASGPGSDAVTDDTALPPAIRDFLLDVERRRGDDLPPSAGEGGSERSGGDAHRP
jgi:hypothetical protein